MTPEKLLDMLEGPQRNRGYRFSPDRRRTLELLEGLLVNRGRYGYMSCPCRLAAGDPDWDRDIICPCVYREPDVREFGTCYCGLYVSASAGEDQGADVYVPERRPPGKYRRPGKRS